MMTADTIMETYRTLTSARRQYYPGGVPNAEDRAGLARVVDRKLGANLDQVMQILEAAHG